MKPSIEMIDAAMAEMANIHPPLIRSECARLIGAALAAARTAQQPSWQPIELAPKDGTEVIVGVDVASVWIARNARFVRAEEWMHREPEDTDGWWAYKNSVSQEQLDGIYEPTHYLPMPDPSAPPRPCAKNNEFLIAVREYIECVEVQLDSEYGLGRSIEGLIAKNQMPDIYTEVLQRIEPNASASPNPPKPAA